MHIVVFHQRVPTLQKSTHLKPHIILLMSFYFYFRKAYYTTDIKYSVFPWFW